MKGSKVHPVISITQKMTLYETKARYFLVGSNNIRTKFRVLKIDRTEPRDLVVVDDKVQYSWKEIQDLLTRIDVGNRPKQAQKGNSGLSKTITAYGIVGFIRFLEGYYIILITNRRKVAVIGHHTIYKIVDTSMIYIPNDTVRYVHSDEARYVKMFQNVDLSSNFYFSYSYDLTHTLQFNLTPPFNLKAFFPDKENIINLWTDNTTNGTTNKSECIEGNSDDSEFGSNRINKDNQSINDEEDKKDTDKSKDFMESAFDAVYKAYEYGFRPSPTYKYVWNGHLLKHLEIHSDWLLYIIHGFVGQSNINIFGRSIYLTLIGRRSSQFAGTRFLKRGSNCDGQVANDVETEQIVHDASLTSFQKGRFTSFVQMRGSIPIFWSQDTSKMVPKPAIALDLSDPYACSAGLHFNELLRRYGSPIILLNLVKKREKKKHESILSDELLEAIAYLNQFLAPDKGIQYKGFDMARVNKSKSADVLNRLGEIAYNAVKQIGFFQNKPIFHCNKLRTHPMAQGMQGYNLGYAIKQTGVIRVNCVDCLDRTNTAQFAIGKVALAFQLHSLGVLDIPKLDFDTDSVRMLEELYEDHGDTLALQYGGSQLVHRIKTYRKISPWTSHSRDIMQTLSRYYSNTFSDADKQNAINLFLGIFMPEEGKLNIWDLPTDYYLHNSLAAGNIPCHRRSYSQWWESSVCESLPQAWDEVNKGGEKKLMALKCFSSDERIDGFYEYYRPYKLTVVSDLYCFKMPHSVRDFMPNSTSDYNPFTVRIRPGKGRDELGSSSNTSGNPSVTGTPSTSSTSSHTSSGTSSTDEGSSSDECDDHSIGLFSGPSTPPPPLCMKDIFPTMKMTYGVELSAPEKSSIMIYKRFVTLGKNASPHKSSSEVVFEAVKKMPRLIQKSAFSLDSSHHVTPPTVHRVSKDIYKVYVTKGHLGAGPPTHHDQAIYQRYVQNKFR